MPLQLRSRPTTDTFRPRSPSPFATPTTKPQIPTICLTAATPADANTTLTSPVPLAPKPTVNGEQPRRRLVPKKSKLTLLGSSSAKTREQDLSDVVRRVGGASVNNGTDGFEIYVDAANDPDIGEILMVKKKKSRAALDGMHWGALDEVTNVSTVTKPKEKEKGKGGKRESLLKVKTDESQKWWSIGRGRKDSKEIDKARAKSPQPVEGPAETRARFNSLDSGILLTSPVCAEHPKSPVERLRVPTPPSATIVPPGATALGNGKGSVALRAMRSVRSLARIGSWAQLRNPSNPEPIAAPVKEKDPDAKKKKKKKEKEREKEKANQTLRHSGSSFEVGALSPTTFTHDNKSLGKKASILGIGLPSTMRLPSSRSGSTASSVVAANTMGRQLSVDSAAVLGGGILARGRSGSTMSTTSSLRPMSASSCVSGSSSGSSAAASVQWDEAGLATVKEIRRKDRETRRKEREETVEKKNSKKSKSGKDSSRKTLDSRRRTPLASIFSGTFSEREDEATTRHPITPIVTIEEATIDGHYMVGDDSVAGESPMETPGKRIRGRPMSEQLIGRDRPKPLYESDDDHAFMSLLDAATNDLAQLINRLDLEATPGSMDVTPMSSQFSLDRFANSPNRRLATESPVKFLRVKTSSMTSLRPYAQTCSKITGMQLGQNIAPWSTLNAGISPSKPSPSTIRTRADDNTATLRRTQRPSPAPAADPSPVFRALRPATTRFTISKTVVAASSGVSPFVINTADRSPSSLTFGSGHSKSESHGSSLAPSPVFKKAHGHARKRSCFVPQKTNDSPSLPILPDARRSLGLAGTMGGSIGSNAEQELDASDPDSDIPDELQVILSNSDQDLEDTMTFDPESAHTPLPSPGLPPEMPLPEPDSPSPRGSVVDVPIFRISVVDEDYNLDVEEAGAASEDDTKKSFDFTGELQKLNESGVSDRRSFIEQLENAFRTPAKIDLHHDFGNFPSPGVPPLPEHPTLQDELSQAGEGFFNLPIHYESRVLSPMGLPVDVNNLEPSLLAGRDSFATTASDDELLRILAPLRNEMSVGSRPSDGELNRDFRFGGKGSFESNKEKAPLTLSDIIPPPEIARSLSMTSFAGDESALMKSIFAVAVEIPSPPARLRFDSNASSKRRTRDFARSSLIAGHRRDSSMLSFAGFDSFAEVRRGFEFNNSRPGFYPPPGATSNRRHARDESVMSFASVSSYGHVLDSGSSDPFDYASLASLRGRPVSDEFSVSMSTTVDDTFSFIRRQPRRYRVDSDASSFHCRLSQIHPYSRNHRRRESSISFISPPVSLYNRSFGVHRRGDSSASISSIAQSYAMGGASSGRASWAARHLPNLSIDSTLSDFTGTHLGRPGLGDKMLESALDHGMPLTAISASPSGSLAGSVRGLWSPSNENDSRSSYDSIMDIGDEPQKTLPEDSLFDKTGQRAATSSDSTFFEHHSDTMRDDDKLPRYRPISSISIQSVHSPPKEDDTMISMLGGGHVRRRSVTSMIGSSPCIRVERRKNIVTNPPATVFERIKNTHVDDYGSPEKSRVIESKPSIASTTGSTQFGDERMIRARHGLLERQSLENTVLVAEGEDLSGSFRLPVFTRPTSSTRSRSSTCTSTSGAETPPLSISDGYSSFSEASQSSIDLSQLNQLLSNMSHPLSNASFDRVRPPARGHGHRRRISQARASRTSIYETIQEEFTSSLSPLKSPAHSVPGSATKTLKLTDSAPMGARQVFVVDPETSSVESLSLWDDERGITALRKYYALRDEAQDTVTESKRTWLDTPFSAFALQSFDPPRHPISMRAMLEQSRENYGPLSSELRPHRTRSRVNSRPSPYPRTIKTSFTSTSPPDHLQAVPSPSMSLDGPVPHQPGPLSVPLQRVAIDSNLPPAVSSARGKASELKGCFVMPDKAERTFGLPPRSRVGSNPRRTALGWTKKSTGKENNTSLANMSLGTGNGNTSQASGMTPSDGLRLSRPRPRGRPTPAAARPIRA